MTRRMTSWTCRMHRTGQIRALAFASALPIDLAGKSASGFDTACLMIQSLPVVSTQTVFFNGFIARRA